MKRLIEHDLHTMFAMLETSSDDHKKAMEYLEQHKLSSLRVLNSAATPEQKVTALMGLTEDLLHKVCSLFDPLELKDTKAEIILPPEGKQ